MQFVVKIKATFSEDHFGNYITLKFPLPRATDKVTFELTKNQFGQNAEYNSESRTVTWTIKKMQGGQ